MNNGNLDGRASWAKRVENHGRRVDDLLPVHLGDGCLLGQLTPLGKRCLERAPKGNGIRVSYEWPTIRSEHSTTGLHTASAGAILGQAVRPQVCLNLLNGAAQFPSYAPDEKPSDAVHALARYKNVIGRGMH